MDIDLDDILPGDLAGVPDSDTDIPASFSLFDLKPLPREGCVAETITEREEDPLLVKCAEMPVTHIDTLVLESIVNVLYGMMGMALYPTVERVIKGFVSKDFWEIGCRRFPVIG